MKNSFRLLNNVKKYKVFEFHFSFECDINYLRNILKFKSLLTQ